MGENKEAGEISMFFRMMTRRKWSKVSIAQVSFVTIHDMLLENIVAQFKGYT